MKKQFRLPKDFTKKWLEALRSGKYKQANSVMFDPETRGYCCLGVACSMMGISDKKLRTKEVIVDDVNLKYGVFKLKSKLIPEELYGVDITNNLIKKLIKMNDLEQKSFKEIANWIQENVELY